ncbi:hypothetical protein J3R83DRAFT_11784, partial [Lanmaoa asiatica]
IGFSEFTKAFKRSGGFHQVWNLLSLEPNLRFKFDRLELWFESTHQVQVRYKICVFDEEVGTYIRKVFMGPKPHVDGAPICLSSLLQKLETAPPLNRHLLVLHATVAPCSVPLTSWNGIRKRQRSLLLMVRLLLYSVILCPLATFPV